MAVPKSGPALKQLHSHHAIHEGGLAGENDKNNNMMDCLKKVIWKLPIEPQMRL